ncbi:unnamed protein product, partial [Candida parapsilosis]
MKFGKTYLSHQIPEWSIYYMNYKHLKKIIKSIDSVKEESDIDDASYPELISETLSSFFFEIDRNIENVDEFYNAKYKEYERRLTKIIQVLGYNDNVVTHKVESQEELDEIVNILIELRMLFRNLKWFGELNHRGFIKILKKLDKKLSSILNDGQVSEIDVSRNNKEAYLTTRIDALPFANETEVANNLDIIHRILLQLGTMGSTSEMKLETLKIENNVESFQKILEDDDSKALEENILENKTEKFNISLLNKASLLNAEKCINLIWKHLSSLYDEKDINGRNFFHHNVISLGKNQFIKEEQLTPGDSPNWLVGGANGADNNNINNTSGLLQILNKLDDKKLLIAKDHYNRTPLHYAAQYGLVQVTNILLEYCSKWELIDRESSIDNMKIWGDQENLTPLHLSIIGKHPKTTEVLIKFNSPRKLTCPDLLLLSVRLNSSRILNSLITDGRIDIDYTDENHKNESALYIASKMNLPNLVEFLLESNANTEIGEQVFGWTPIFIAACEGYSEIVKLLKEFDANYDIVDNSGWLPMEHACLRGHLNVADLLAASPVLRAKDDGGALPTSIDRLPEAHKHAVNEFYKQLKNNSSGNISRSTSPKRKKRVKAVKSFGHRFLGEDESLILVTLGTTDLRDDRTPVELNKISLAKSFATELDTALSLSITCRYKSTNQQVEPPVVIDLPLEDYHGSATDPVSFKLTNNVSIDDVIITFDLIPTYQVHKKVLGRAIALLKDAYTKVGPHLRFEYLQILPFKHHAMSIARSDTYWKQLVSTRVIGHRGLGKNVSGRQSLQLGENTVESFIAASSLGASYVEFDVQLTKDLCSSGTAPMADIRASSLQNAIRFAKKWNLLGIVSAAQALVKTPRLAQVVKSSGL